MPTIRVWDSKTRQDVDVEMSPEHEEFIVFASAPATTHRTSPDLTNKYARALLLLLDVTGVAGTGEILGVRVEAKVAAGYHPIAEFTPGSPINAADKFAFLMTDSGGYENPSMVPVTMRSYWQFGRLPRTYRVVVVVGGSAGNTITFSLTGVHLL